MRGPTGNRPELYEPGSRVVYIRGRDGKKILRGTGVVASQTARGVTLETGERVWKDHVLMRDDRPAGQSMYRVILHHTSGQRIDVLQWGRTADHARQQAQARADRMFGPGSFAAKGSGLCRHALTWRGEE